MPNYHLYVEALHIIFIVTWFAGMFYMPRLFIYNTEANDKDVEAQTVLGEHFKIMMKILSYRITIPSGLLTLIFGPWMWIIMGALPQWLVVKLIFVILLYI